MADDLNFVASSVWSVYLTMHTEVDENDQRRCTLHRFIKKRYAAGERDYDDLMGSGLAYLKKLDRQGDFELLS
jgi:hypothetical protein